MKFFRTGLSRFSNDTDRALKNSLSDNLFEFIHDEIYNFNDTQSVRALLVLSMVQDTRISKLRDKVLQHSLNNIIAGRFKLRTGTSIPAFA